MPDLAKYKPRQFTTTALQQAKVQLTWDETNTERKEITQKINTGKLDEVDENDIQAYLASGTSDEESGLFFILIALYPIRFSVEQHFFVVFEKKSQVFVSFNLQTPMMGHLRPGLS